MSHRDSPRMKDDALLKAVHSYVDRELGPAETEALEKAMAASPKLQAERRTVEGLSAALKRWDAESNEHVAPRSRIQNAVLARVAHEAGTRRREHRMRRFRTVAIAASVLLAFGLAIFFGANVDPNAADGVEVALEPLVFDGTAEDIGVTKLASDRSGLPGLVPKSEKPLDGFELAEKVRVRVRHVDGDSIAEFEVLRRVRDDYERGLGETGVLMPDYLGRKLDRIVSPSVLRYLFESGIIYRWMENSGTLPASAASATAAPETGTLSDLTIATALTPVPGLLNDISPLKVTPPLVARPVRDGRGETVTIIKGLPIHRSKAGPIRLLTSDGEPTRAVDPIAAQNNGWLRFEEIAHTPNAIVAFVRDSQRPIYIPAGQILTGGVTDRVVAKAVWLSPDEERTTIECRVVREGAPRAAGRPVLTEWIAGPTLRALLYRNAPEDEFRACVAGQVHGLGDEWSLLDVYEKRKWRSRGRELKLGPAIFAEVRASMRRVGGKSGLAGFAVVGEGDRVLGIEKTRIHGEAALLLLARLYVGYETEAWERFNNESYVAKPSDEISTAFKHFRGHTKRFVLQQRDPSSNVRVSGLADEKTGIRFHAVEVDDEVVAVSAVAEALPHSNR